MLNIEEFEVQTVSEEQLFQDLMRQHHYLGFLPKIGETLWYAASWKDQWVALSSFSAAALKCSARDSWIGWDFRQKFDYLGMALNTRPAAVGV